MPKRVFSLYTFPPSKPLFAALGLTLKGVDVVSDHSYYIWMFPEPFRFYEELIDVCRGEAISLLQLVMRERRCNQAQAWKWLQKQKLVRRIFLITSFPLSL